MLRVLIAPAAYKGSLSPGQLAAAIEAGARHCQVAVETAVTPLADGGDGTIEALNMALGGHLHPITVEGPLGRPVQACWLELAGLAVVELASASGIARISAGRLAPLDAHTVGLGELLRDCLAGDSAEIVVTVGGSASTDGGTGALRALGARFLDRHGMELPLGGEA